MPRLLIAPDDLAAVERRAVDAFPAECCGLLLGRPEGEDGVRIGWVEECVNQAPDRHCRFTISPEELMTAYRWARDRGEKVVGTYHSHPGGTAEPSETDRQSAWPGASYLIVGLTRDGVRERRSWRLEGEEFVAEEVVVRLVETEEDEP